MEKLNAESNNDYMSELVPPNLHYSGRKYGSGNGKGRSVIIGDSHVAKIVEMVDTTAMSCSTSLRMTCS